MSRRRQTQGVDRVLTRLEKNVEDGKYYDAFQMYKSVYHRYEQTFNSYNYFNLFYRTSTRYVAIIFYDKLLIFNVLKTLRCNSKPLNL